MTDTKVELETNCTSQTPFYNEFLECLFIFILLYKKRNGYKSSFKFLLPNVAVIN